MNIANRLIIYLLLFLFNFHLSYAHANLSSQLLNEEEQSRSPSAHLASGVKLGVQTWNDFKNLTQAYQQGQTLMFFLERYGNVGVDFGQSKYTHNYTTTQSPFFNVGVADFGDMTEVRLLDGTVLLAKDRVILPKNLILGKATDTNEERLKSTSTSIGINVFTKMPSVSHNQSQSQSSQQTHRNAVIQITNPHGVLDATHSQSLILDGGRITAPRAQGRIDHVTVTSHQDHATSSHSGFGFGISGTLATGLRGSVNVARGQAYEQAVQDEAGLKIQDPTGFSIGNLTVTGPTLNPHLATLADQVTFHPLKDKKDGWSFQGSLCNLDLTSPEGFMQSLQQGVQQAVRSALAAEITHQAGGKGILPSAVGILAGLNHAQDGTTQDLNITGGFSFRDGKRDFEIPFINFNSKPTPSLPFLFYNQQDSQDKTPSQDETLDQPFDQKISQAIQILNDMNKEGFISQDLSDVPTFLAFYASDQLEVLVDQLQILSDVLREEKTQNQMRPVWSVKDKDFKDAEIIQIGGKNPLVGIFEKPIKKFIQKIIQKGDQFPSLPKHSSQIKLKFKKDEGEKHFSKHASRIQKVLGKTSYNFKEYIRDANHVINNGTYIPELNAFIKIVGGKGNAKVAFVGIERSKNIITTFHVREVKEIIKKAPSLGWKK